MPGPFFDISNGLNDTDLIAFPGSSAGSVAARASSGNLLMTTVDLTENVLDTGWFRLDSLLGYRFYTYGEGVSISQRITVIDVSFKKNPEEKIVLINPAIIAREGKQLEEEGCLSLPEIREKVSRAAKVKVKAQDVTGEWFEVEGEELLARAMQHEIDHLDGVLFLKHLGLVKRYLIRRRIRKLQKAGQW